MGKEDCCHDKSKCSRRRGRRGLLEPTLLVVLATQESHGYELPSAVEQMTGVCPDSAAVYRMLRSLEEVGTVESYWVPADSGPARREYRITDQGRALLGEWALELAERAEVCASLSATAARVAEQRVGDPAPQARSARLP